MKPFILATLACAIALALPTSAPAQQGNAPPGNSGIDEYVESVPGAGGNRPSKRQGEKKGDGKSPLSDRARDSLRSAGAEGRAAEELISETAPGALGASGGKGSGKRDAESGGAGSGDGTAVPLGGATGQPGGAAEAESKGTLASVSDALTGSGSTGMGIILPLVLALALLFAISRFALSRRRRSA